MPDENPFAPLTKDEYAALMTEDAPADPRDELPEDGGVESPEKGRTAVLNAVARVEADPETPKKTVRRRRVTKTEKKHIAQDVIANAVAVALGYWREDMALKQRLANAGISEDDFAPLMQEQANRAVRAVGFEEAWSA